MRRYILKRLLQLIPVLLGISFLTFTLTYLSPGDPAELMLNATGVTPTPQLVEKVREGMGLNKPFLTRYGEWLTEAARGDFGVSYQYNRPVSDVILARMPATLELAGTSMLLMMAIALPLGIISALYRNRVLDYIIRMLSFGGISVPGFGLGLGLMYIFSVKLKLLPIMGKSDGTSLILPTVTLAMAMASKYIRQLRVAILEEMGEDYVVGARARGLKDQVILLKHILQKSLLPIVTLLGLSVGSLLGGAAIVETIFVWPGVGKLAVDAIFSRDYPLIQGYVVWMAIIYVVVNLVVDISYYFLDPRIHLGKEG
ncbi:ABC transporter permease [Desulfosporosinus sp. PR]|uniref:nickel ABC transporter permease n=1 Tax=Candidatus Desulfosporosinus nitrosoreducens TaxID=3401928 RepID=UPI0027F9FAAB|nr:nickel ABC transporter permease [Desulfosporosinus sp. PR]MDQ7093793.1 ABC transporter permease [Desulfosporosinus sp. PR]